MKRLLLLTITLIVLASCATLFTGTKAKVQIAGNTNSTPVDLVVDGKRYESVFSLQL